jgi:hypothetical protein
MEEDLFLTGAILQDDSPRIRRRPFDKLQGVGVAMMNGTFLPFTRSSVSIR